MEWHLIVGGFGLLVVFVVGGSWLLEELGL
jgi:hypothetical protein